MISQLRLSLDKVGWHSALETALIDTAVWPRMDVSGKPYIYLWLHVGDDFEART